MRQEYGGLWQDGKSADLSLNKLKIIDLVSKQKLDALEQNLSKGIKELIGEWYTTCNHATNCPGQLKLFKDRVTSVDNAFRAETKWSNISDKNIFDIFDKNGGTRFGEVLLRDTITPELNSLFEKKKSTCSAAQGPKCNCKGFDRCQIPSPCLMTLPNLMNESRKSKHISDL